MKKRAIRHGVAMVLVLALSSSPAAAELVTVDATKAALPPRSAHLHMGAGAGPHGTIGVNNRYLTRDRRPWLPVMGEFHFSRFPASGWEDEILKMKAAGVSIIATYVIWNQIEREPGQLDWTGDRDIRRFAELCAKHDMLLFVRPGPWAHAETRFGGIPDWVVSTTRPRSNDPAYLAEVERFWRGLAEQLKGELWKDGGPIVGLQIENEYNLDGESRGRAHIATLKALAVRLGFDVPLYTVTGWDQTIYPKGEVVPVQGGYPDEPWSAKLVKLPPKENYLFRFHSRVSGDLGAQTRAARGRGDADDDVDDTPFLGAEYGGGVPVMYRRRPLLSPADVGAAVTTQVGSGVNLLGYYMFHGGANPLAHGRSLEETQRSGGYNDVPAIGYDFQAPIGQYGEVNAVSGAIRPLHYLLESYGDRLATMIPHEPAVQPSGPADMSTLRWSVRSDGDAGFLFVNNHVRQYAMAPHGDVRFDVRLPSGKVRIPSTGVTIADGASFVWPVNLDLDGVRLVWATAQPVTRLRDEEGAIHVLLATQPGAVELAFAAAGIRSVSVPTKADAAGRLLAQVLPSTDRLITIEKLDSTKVRILLLDAGSAKRIWVGDVGGTRRLVLTDADLFFSGKALVLRQRGEPHFRFSTWPLASDVSANAEITRRGTAMEASVAGPPAGSIAITSTRAPGEAPPIEIGGPAKAAMQPLPESHRADAVWSFIVPQSALRDVEDAYLEIDYRGDIGRVSDGTTMLDDAFWDGRVWRIGLKRFAARLGHPWSIAIMPLRADAPIYLDERARALLPKAAQVAELRSIRLVPEYELRVTLR
ncbi:beta-galactosidase [Sphingomonas sp. BIUV-7]|uniref:Beta-galactosidase n=1 Tax=Sphingomonas natans TaxID=3063330 RepID=A0ABT8Y3G6_9SPHN|nr:beta-galactosidase [Sphingomonas sp. BIUV-7]MDO6412847.1 beta-galactosidase [Sphingomonas sp. BIUV-7]